MANGYVFAYCDIARQYYSLTLMDDGKTVSDFTFCDAPAKRGGKITTCLVTDASLRACPVCGGRAVAQCDCMRRVLPCEPLVGFRFSCIYCRNLRLLGTFPAP